MNYSSIKIPNLVPQLTAFKDIRFLRTNKERSSYNSYQYRHQPLDKLLVEVASLSDGDLLLRFLSSLKVKESGRSFLPENIKMIRQFGVYQNHIEEYFLKLDEYRTTKKYPKEFEFLKTKVNTKLSIQERVGEIISERRRYYVPEVEDNYWQDDSYESYGGYLGGGRREGGMYDGFDEWEDYYDSVYH
jgi:hypothetical protein